MDSHVGLKWPFVTTLCFHPIFVFQCLTSVLNCCSIVPCSLSSHTTASSSRRTSDLSSGAITRVTKRKKEKEKENLPATLRVKLHLAVSEHYLGEKLNYKLISVRTGSVFQQIRVSVTYFANNHGRCLSSLCILLLIWLSDVTGSRKSQDFRAERRTARIFCSVSKSSLRLCSRCCRRLLFSFAAISSQVRSSLSHSRLILVPSPLPFSPRCRRGSLILPRDLSWKEEGCKAPPPKISPPLRDGGATW